MKVAHLTTVHQFPDTRIFYKMCVTLAAQGYDVTLVTRAERQETIQGVQILPLPKRQCGSRWGRFIYSWWDGYRAIRKLSPDLVHFHDAELLPLSLIFRMLGMQVIYDAHEDLPKQILSKPYLPLRARRVVAWLCSLLERVSAVWLTGIVVANPGQMRPCFPGSKTELIQNFPILDEFKFENETPYSARPVWFAYAGGLTAIRGAREMLQAIERVEQPEAQLSLAGRFESKALEREVASMPGWRRVVYLGWQSRSQISALLGQARAGLVVLHPVPNFLSNQTVKMFEYMAAGIPVIASDFPLWREIIESHQCGLLVDPLDVGAIAAAMQWILDHPQEAAAMGQRGRQAVVEKYNWEKESVKLRALYERLFGHKSPNKSTP
ncbi:MAG: glycosyltransferase family 4 protein [Lentisphaerae bacterium]|nr:glycosyltransferase family 4 protein [Lentisphaerota bacterium]